MANCPRRPFQSGPNLHRSQSGDIGAKSRSVKHHTRCTVSLKRAKRRLRANLRRNLTPKFTVAHSAATPVPNWSSLGRSPALEFLLACPERVELHRTDDAIGKRKVVHYFLGSHSVFPCAPWIDCSDLTSQDSGPGSTPIHLSQKQIGSFSSASTSFIATT